MYNFYQYSLKEYGVINTGVNIIYYKLERFHKTEYTQVGETVAVPGDSEIKFFLESDGIYKVTVANDESFEDILNSYIIHNITDLLKRRQNFLTKSLTEYNVDKCNHNHYYDFIAFNILFDTYNKLVQDTFVTSITPANLYKIEYLFNQLQKY